MARIRHGREPGFAMIPNTTIDDTDNLDLTALGLLTVLLRQKDGWEITLERVGKRYGYGRDAMANAMGLLQVARYVVKVRVQNGSNAQWSTEIITYAIPPSDAEVAELLVGIAEEPGVSDVRLIEPTPTAVKRAQARLKKLRKDEPGEPEFPQVSPSDGKPAVGDSELDKKGDPECRVFRQSANPAVSKKTVLEENSLPPSPSQEQVPVVVVPSAGASGEEEEISRREEEWCDGGEDALSRPSRRLSVVPESQESPKPVFAPQKARQSFGICRQCWSTYVTQPTEHQKYCPSCR